MPKIVTTTIDLPNSASAVKEEIRSFCEHHGCFDTATVDVMVMGDGKRKLVIRHTEGR